jgi:aminopeptidase N
MKKAGLAGLLCLCLLPALFGQKVDFSQKPLQTERSRSFDALHYRIEITLDIAEKSFRGETTVTLSSLREGLEKIVLDAEAYTVTRVRGQWGKELPFYQEDKHLTVELARTLNIGEVFSFTVSYRGKDPSDGLRFYEETAENPALVASDSWPSGVHHWFPCYDYPNDKVTNEVIATVKRPNKVCANGRLVRVFENPAEDTVTYHWSQEQSHSTYLIFLAAAPYVVIEDKYETIPINYWVYPQHEEDALRTYKKTPLMMKFFNEIFDYPFPWAKYDQISVPFGGGMENTSATAMTHRIIHDERAAQDYSSIGIVSHELAHQWWGDLITLRTWAHAWMNEGFGTYCDYLYTRFDRGNDEGAVNLLGKKDAYLGEARNRYIRPIVSHRYDRPEDLFDSHSYPKGAVVLHMLRDIVGDELFFKTLSYFLHRYAFDVVDTHDFERAVKTVTGQSLDWFFDQWVYKPGHPVLDIGSTYDEERGSLNLTVRQVQDTSPGVPVFVFPVDIAIVTSRGRRTERIWIRKAEESFTFPVLEKPALVRFDERNVLLKEWTYNKDMEELIFQAGNDDVIGRMWALSELLRFTENPEALRTLADSAKKDQFWAVRRAAVKSLGTIKNPFHEDLLKRSAEDPNSQVRVSALNALGDFGNTKLIAFFKQRFRKDTSYAAQAAALSAVGKTGDASQIPFLRTAAQTPSHRDWIKNAAEKAINELQEKK